MALEQNSSDEEGRSSRIHMPCLMFRLAVEITQEAIKTHGEHGDRNLTGGRDIGCRTHVLNTITILKSVFLKK